MTDPLRDAHRVLFERYRDLLRDAVDDNGDTSPVHLRWMCETGIANIETFPVDKLARWLGFVQGCLAMRGIVDVRTERDVSRPLFHAAYGADAPATIERPR